MPNTHLYMLKSLVNDCNCESSCWFGAFGYTSFVSSTCPYECVGACWMCWCVLYAYRCVMCSTTDVDWMQCASMITVFVAKRYHTQYTNIHQKILFYFNTWNKVEKEEKQQQRNIFFSFCSFLRGFRFVRVSVSIYTFFD